MQIILIEPVLGLGSLGDVVTVKDGYARNYLLPQKKALPASKANLERFEAERKAREDAFAEAKATAEKQAEQHFTDASITLERNASEAGQLYGSVKARDIVAALDESLSLSASAIQIGEPIKTIGEHSVNVALHADVIAPLTIKIQRPAAA